MNNQDESWTEIISPKTNLFDFKLKEVWRYRDLIVLFVKRDFVSAYKQTVLGWLWHIITPFINVVLYTLVFNKIANLSTEGVPPFLFQTISYTTWGYFVACFGSASGVFGGNAHLFSKVYFPRLSVPLASCLSAFFKLLIQLAFAVIVWIYYYWQGIKILPTLYLLAVPFLFLLMTVMGLGLGMFISALTTKYRDLQNVVGYGVAAMMYGSAVLYPLSQIPEVYREYAGYNPLIPIMEAMRQAFLGIGTFDWQALSISAVLAVLFFILGIMAFNKAERNFIDTV